MHYTTVRELYQVEMAVSGPVGWVERSRERRCRPIRHILTLYPAFNTKDIANPNFIPTVSYTISKNKYRIDSISERIQVCQKPGIGIPSYSLCDRFPIEKYSIRNGISFIIMDRWVSLYIFATVVVWTDHISP